MNCNDKTDLDVDVFMNHGWGSFQLFEAIKPDGTYTTYSHMEKGADGLWHGDVVLFDGDRVVGFFGQIAVSDNSPRQTNNCLLTLFRFKAFLVVFSR